jgi:paraquat-inducible protein A
VKLLAGLFIWARLDAGAAAAHRALGFVQVLGKWSMVDVFVVALTVVAINITIVADVEVNAGIYMFCAAVFLSMVEMQLLERIIRRAHRAGAPRDDT